MNPFSAPGKQNIDGDLALWHALYVRSNFERAVERGLQRKGFTVLLPTYRATRRWSDRTKQLELPLFRGYVFCRLDPRNTLTVLNTPGVVQIVGQTKTPVSELEIESVRRIVNSDLAYEPCDIAVGQRVVIQNGPLTGVEGVLVPHRTSQRLVVPVNMLQRAVAVETDLTWVMACPQAPHTELQTRTQALLL